MSLLQQKKNPSNSRWPPPQIPARGIIGNTTGGSSHRPLGRNVLRVQRLLLLLLLLLMIMMILILILRCGGGANAAFDPTPPSSGRRNPPAAAAASAPFAVGRISDLDPRGSRVVRSKRGLALFLPSFSPTALRLLSSPLSLSSLPSSPMPRAPAAHRRKRRRSRNAAPLALGSGIIDQEDEGKEGTDPNVPPELQLDDVALHVFSGPYFLPEPGTQEEDGRHRRVRILQGQTVRRVFEEIFDQEQDLAKALGVLSRRIGVSLTRLRTYCASANPKARRSVAAILFKAKYKGDFREAVVPIGTSLGRMFIPSTNPPSTSHGGGGGGREGADNRRLDLGFLGPLRLPVEEEGKGRAPEEAFLLPPAVHVRDCMRTVFGLFREDVERGKPPGSQSAALVGSSGVGTSILFFLSALHQATARTVVYCRLTNDQENEKPSLFVMMPEDDDKGAVRVWFSRNMDKRSIHDNGGITRISLDLESALYVGRDECYCYIDGPNHREENNLMGGTYDYFCTSEGFPRYKGSEAGKRLWVLDGWTHEEAMDGLALLNHDKLKAEDAYFLCGGNIRDMIKACDSFQEVRKSLDALVEEDVDTKSIELAVTNALRNRAASNPDRLRTMFERRLEEDGDSWKGVMRAYQRVDSSYVMGRLLEILESGPFFEAYRLSRNQGITSAEGIFFEYLFHKRVQEIAELEMLSFEDVCFSKGTAAQGLEMLSRPKIYWKPSTPNFKAVDSALVIDDVLYVFQFTIMDKKKYDGDALERDFVRVVRGKIRFQGGTVVVFVSPAGTNYRVQEHAATTGSLTYWAREVDLTSLSAMDRTTRKLFDEICPRAVSPSDTGTSTPRSEDVADDEV
jgi:hypothetical protein